MDLTAGSAQREGLGFRAAASDDGLKFAQREASETAWRLMNERFPAGNGHGAPGKSAYKGMAVVQCEGFRCLAYRDTENRWRDLQTGKELPHVKEVVHTFV